MAVDLDEYRREADAFLGALSEEQYLHYSGQKESLELEALFDRHADLTSLGTCLELREAGAPLLRRFACEGYLAGLVVSQDERVAHLEATLEAEVGGEHVPYRMLRPLIANEPDRVRREQLERARASLAGELNPVREEAQALVTAAAAELGAPTISALYAELGLPLERLRDECAQFLEQTASLHAELFDAVLRARAGVTLAEARPWDVPRVLRSDRWDDGFPADRLLSALEATLAELGIVLAAQHNVVFDIDARPTKDPRAFCAPIAVPGRIVLCVKPVGGADDWRALFHEAGHTEHFAHTQAHLPLEARRLGDNAVTEGWAFLLEGLTTNARWLSRRLDFGRAEQFAAESGGVQLYLMRRYCAKLLYELELHGGASLEEMPARYAELLTEATSIPVSPAYYLDDVDPGFYVTSYVRAWAFEALVRSALAERFGSTWFTSRKAGSLLRELWSEGQGLDADTIVDELTGATLELSAAVEGLAGR
ncbi:MAG: hypothetical protein U0R69_02755 [Gaiellales bacterium]